MTHVAPSFDRSMKMLGCMLITLSSVTPASSVFIVVPGVVEQAGSGAFLCFLLAGLVSFFTALVYAELGSAFPFAGGEYAIIGRILGPFAGFIIMGVNLIVLVLGIAVVAIGFGAYVQTIFPWAPTKIGALACIAVTSLCAVLNVRTNALITGVFLALELLALIVVAVLGFAHPARPWTALVWHPVYAHAGHIAAMPLGAVGLATSIAIFAFYGFGSAIYLGEEVKNAPRSVAGAVIWALVIGVVSQALPLAAALHSAPNLLAMFTSETMFGDFVRVRGGAGLGAVVNLSVALAILNANIAIVVLGSRMIFSSGRDRVWSDGLNRFLTLMHARHGSPWAATLVTGVLAGVLCFVDFNLLLVMSGTAIVVVYASLCVAVIVGRRNGSTSHGVYRMPFFPWPPLLALVALLYFIFTNMTDPKTGAISLVAMIAIVVVSALYYALLVKRRGAWVLKQPSDLLA